MLKAVYVASVLNCDKELLHFSSKERDTWDEAMQDGEALCKNCDEAVYIKIDKYFREDN